jgi:hypothetical protein
MDRLGTGAGASSFQSIFPLYRPASLDGTGFWNSAHNGLSRGFVGSWHIRFHCAALGSRWSDLQGPGLGYFLRRRDSHFPLIAVGATILVHLPAFVDFSLQIQVVTLTFVALLALGLAQSQAKPIWLNCNSTAQFGDRPLLCRILMEIGQLRGLSNN